MGHLKKLSLLYVVYPKKDKKLKAFVAQLLKKGHIVCANVIGGMESHYVWKNKVETSQEIVVIYKIKSEKADEVSSLIEKSHPYEVPFIALIDLKSVNKGYLEYAKLTT